MTARANWLAFWDAPHAIYVNDRHRDVHYRALADDITGLLPSDRGVALDYGCGEALHADRIAGRAERLILCEAAPSVLASLRRRFAQVPNIEVRAPDELAALQEASVDLIALVSVSQYLSRGEFTALLRGPFRRLLGPQGRLLVADVIPPGVSAWADARALLRFAREHGFFWPAVAGLARTALSDYRKVRAAIGLTLYRETEFKAVLHEAGYATERLAHNIGRNPARMTFLARLV